MIIPYTWKDGVLHSAHPLTGFTKSSLPTIRTLAGVRSKEVIAGASIPTGVAGAFVFLCDDDKVCLDSLLFRPVVVVTKPIPSRYYLFSLPTMFIFHCCHRSSAVVTLAQQACDLMVITSWWRHQMETFSALLAICAGNSPVPVNSPHKGQWRRALMFSLICFWINGWVNNREAGHLRRYRAHYDVTAMIYFCDSKNDFIRGGTTYYIHRASCMNGIISLI